MRRLFITILYSATLFSISFESNAQRERMSESLSQESIPVIDLTIKYPEKAIVLQDVADVDYIPLQKTGIFPVQGRSCNYFSDRTFITANRPEGDIFIFNTNDGSLRFRFNRKGDRDNQYSMIQELAYDEKAGEIFVIDNIKHTILVYSERGDLLRTLPVDNDVTVEKMHNYDDSSLLVCNKYIPDSLRQSENDINPFLIISKKDGSIIERIKTNFFKRRPDKLLVPNDMGTFTVSIPTRDCSLLNGKDLFIIGFCSDTLFLFSEGVLQPIFLRSTSVENETSPILVGLKSAYGEYLEMSATQYNPMDRNKFSTSTRILYNTNTGELFYPKYTNGDDLTNRSTTLPTSMDQHQKDTKTAFVSSFYLIKQLRENKLSGKLKSVAEGLKEDDNPVLMIVRYR